MKNVIETERLFLREFNVSDAISFYELNSDLDVLKYTGDVPFENVLEAKNFLKTYNDYKKNGFGRWVVFCKEDNHFLGWCGLKLNETKEVNIGFRILKSEWGKGYATEAAKATLQYGFERLEINEIIGRASIDNLNSIRILEKLDMHFLKISDYVGVGKSAYYYITRDQFLKNKSK